MAADSGNSTKVYTDVLEILVNYFEVDVSFLRRNDHEIGASILVAEWPLRPEIPDPDPCAWCTSPTPTRSSQRPSTARRR